MAHAGYATLADIVREAPAARDSVAALLGVLCDPFVEHWAGLCFVGATSGEHDATWGDAFDLANGERLHVRCSRELLRYSEPELRARRSSIAIAVHVIGAHDARTASIALLFPTHVLASPDENETLFAAACRGLHVAPISVFTRIAPPDRPLALECQLDRSHRQRLAMQVHTVYDAVETGHALGAHAGWTALELAEIIVDRAHARTVQPVPHAARVEVVLASAHVARRRALDARAGDRARAARAFGIGRALCDLASAETLLGIAHAPIGEGGALPDALVHVERLPMVLAVACRMVLCAGSASALEAPTACDQGANDALRALLDGLVPSLVARGGAPGSPSVWALDVVLASAQEAESACTEGALRARHGTVLWRRVAQRLITSLFGHAAVPAAQLQLAKLEHTDYNEPWRFGDASLLAIARAAIAQRVRPEGGVRPFVEPFARATTATALARLVSSVERWLRRAPEARADARRPADGAAADAPSPPRALNATSVRTLERMVHAERCERAIVTTRACLAAHHAWADADLTAYALERDQTLACAYCDASVHAFAGVLLPCTFGRCAACGASACAACIDRRARAGRADGADAACRWCGAPPEEEAQEAGAGAPAPDAARWTEASWRARATRA
jgi:hypothetical protein